MHRSIRLSPLRSSCLFHSGKTFREFSRKGVGKGSPIRGSGQTQKAPFKPFLKRSPHFTCPERVNRGHVPAVLSMVFIARFVQSPIWFSSRPRRRTGTHPATAGPENRLCLLAAHSVTVVLRAGIPDPWRLTTGQTAERRRQKDAAGSNQSSGFARPLSGSRRHPVIQRACACRSPFHS